MNTSSLLDGTHDHTFGLDQAMSGEKRTLAVIWITAAMMVVEISAGLYSGSMALLADGLHMGSHASALAISAFAYLYTRSHARDARFSFGTGKMNSLAAFASAVLLAAFAAVMAWESAKRFVAPVPIKFDQAILIALLGLAVNGACLLILGGDGHDHDAHDHDEHDHDPAHHHGERADHNLWSAYVHVLADALTSVLAIAALVVGKYFHLTWPDPFIGILGAVLVSRWAWQLIRASSRVLLDMQAPESVREAVRSAVERQGDCRVSDLHVWAVGPNIFAAEIGILASEPKEPDEYRGMLPRGLNLVHVTCEVRRRPSGGRA